MKRLLLALAALTVLVLTSTTAAANVLVVDGSGRGPFNRIQPAVDAAQDGDTILVKRGRYGSFTIVNKKLVVVADTHGDVIIHGIRVSGLSADRSVALENLKVFGTGISADWHTDALYLDGDIGAIRVQGCTLTGGLGSSAATPQPPCRGADIEASSDVAFVSCTMHGGQHSPMFAGTPGLAAVGSMVAVYDSQVFGGAGDSLCEAPNYYPNGYDGGPGATLTDSFLFASGAHIEGGAGGDAGTPPCYKGDGGDGGAGILLHGSISASDAELLDTELLGGQGGKAGCGIGCGNDGNPRASSALGAGSVLDVLQGSKRSLSAPPIVIQGTPMALNVHGVPGDTVYLLMSRGTSFEYENAFKGVNFIARDRSSRTISLGAVNPVTGRLDTTILPPELGLGEQARSVYLQILVRTEQGAGILGSPANVVVLAHDF